MTAGHPAVVKAKRLARIAVEHGWKGNIESESGTTLFTAWRNDESIVLEWSAGHLVSGQYKLFDHTRILSSTSEARKHIEGWPNIMQILKHFPGGEFRTKVVERYNNVPFDWQTASNEDMMAAMMDREIYWYSHLSAKIQRDHVLKPKTKPQAGRYEIKQVGHRKMFNFIGTVGFRSVLLDTLIQVG